MPSPICSVKDGAGAFVASTTKVVVTPGNVITIALDTPAGAGVWELTCTSADELSDAVAITAGIVINQVTKQATFTCPAASGRSFIFRSRVQSGVGPLATGGYGTRSDYEDSFKIYTAAVGGRDVGAVGETVEGGPIGMAESINQLIRAGGSASVPTGTGIPHIVGGVQSAASSLIVNADVDAAAAISVSKLAAGTNTYVLTTTAGVPVWAAAPGAGSVPTGTGFYTVTGGAMDAAAKSAGTGIYTFLATPSSANLAAALTDETGTGEVVFSTTPTLKTSVKVNNPANTFAYTLTPAAIAANRTLNLPLLTGTDTLVGEAHTATLTNKTIAAGSNTITGLTNTNVDAAAAIAVSKLAAGTNTYVLTTTGGVPVWAAPSGGGSVPTGTGFYTVTGGVMDAASAPYGAGALTFLATPSSANLATMVTDETGSGSLVFQTSPTFKTGVLLNNPANTFAYTFTPAAIAANRTITLPLLTSGDTMVTEAFAQTLTNKTINGSNNTITNVAISTAVSGLGAGVATFLATPSSANLAAAVTDETGSAGELVFSTTPTFKTSVKVNNPANTFAYTLTPAAIAANRTLNLPLLTGTDTLVGEAHAATLTNKTIAAGSNTITGLANANVDAAAAIAVSKLAAGTNTHVLTTTGGVPVWAAPAGGGSVPTGTGFYTVTAGVMDAASAPYGTGALTFLATPSSANLRSMLTDETGTGEAVFSTTPTFKTSVKVNNPANTFAYTLTPAAIAADRTLTLPLLTGADTMVTEAFTQTLTNKTINGSNNTITNVAISTAVSGLGANVATFLATPSSANLAAAVTDETGTAGELVFSTTPTFKTSVKVNNPANTFAYTLTPAAIAANRTLNLPLLTGADTLVGEAFTQTLTNKTIDADANTITNIENADIKAAAAIAVSKLAAGTNTHVLTTTGGVPVWAAPAAAAQPTGTGFYTVTSGVMDAASAPYAAGVLTFLATPSSANLRSMLTDESGTGEAIFSTSPTFKTGVLLNNPGNTFAYTFTPAAIAANRTITLPLLAGNDTMVTEAFSQTLTNKTINGSSNTITNVAIGTAVSGLGTNVATFLGTPSSANLAAALTDETGTGEAVFSTTPTFKTSVKINNPGNTFAYTLTPAAIAANRTLTLPLLAGNDTAVCEAFTQTLTNKTIDASSNTISNIVNANVNTSAAIAGTKISPDFGSQNVVTTGYFGTAASPAATSGNIRIENTHKICSRNSTNSANVCVCQFASSDVLFIGLNSSYGEQAYGIIAGGSAYVYLAVNTTFYLHLEASEIRAAMPIVGDDTVYASHGAADSAMTDANYTVPASEYKYYTIKFLCVGATTRTVTFPHPSSLARSYTKQIIGSTEKILTISTGTGTTVNLAAAKSRIFEFTNGGVRAVGPEY